MASNLHDLPDSPCIGVCSTLFDEVCKGCGRTAAEVSNWVFLSDDEKRAVWERIKREGTAMRLPVRQAVSHPASAHADAMRPPGRRGPDHGLPAGGPARPHLTPPASPPHSLRRNRRDALRFRSDFPLPASVMGAMTPRVLRHDRPSPTGMPGSRRPFFDIVRSD
ncbi:putative Fe-S protein YdhL (DUF1289 family) [Burkholderia ambifaria]